MPTDYANEPLTIGDFVVTMNVILIEIYGQLSRPEFEEKMTDLATRLHEVATRITVPTRRVIVGGLADTLMATENGGLGIKTPPARVR